MLNPTVVVVIDSDGALAPWYQSPDLWALGACELPPRFLHVGGDPAAEGHERLLHAPMAGGSLDRAALASALSRSLRAVADAQSTAEAVRAGRSVSERTTILLVLRSGDPLADGLPAIVHELHSVIARLFPGLNSHVALAVLLPSLFAGASDTDASRTYGLLRWIDRAAGDAAAMRMYPAPRRPFQSVWLANSINENGHAVGQFPAAFDSLTAFLQALLIGAVPLPDWSDYGPGGATRCYGTFGCSVLTAEREALRDAVAATLYADLLPRLFGGPPGSPDVAAREAERFVSASQLARLESLIGTDREGAPLYTFPHPSWSSDTAKQTGTVLADLEAHRQDLEQMRREVLPRMERRHKDLERELQEATRVAAASRADTDSCESVEWFLESLVADPPENDDLLGHDSQFTFFGLLGRAIDRLDSLIGFTEPRQRVTRLQERLTALDEQRRKLEASATMLEERISSARLRGVTADAETASAELEVCRSSVTAVAAEIRAVRAQHRGQLIADRSFHMGQRQSAVTRRRSTLAEQATQAVEAYTGAVDAWREMSTALAELYDRRRRWLIRRLVSPPALAVAALLLQALWLATPWGDTTDLVTFYTDNAAVLTLGGATALLTYLATTAWTYRKRFAIPVRAAERQLRRLDDFVSMRAEACARADRDTTEFMFLVFQCDAAIRTLLTVRTYGRDELLPKARQFRDWVSRPITWTATPATLYRSPTWSADQVSRMLARVLEGVPNVDALFWAATGARSSWAFLEPAAARQRLDAFARQQFKRIGELSAEETLFHARFGIDKTLADNLVLSIDLAAAPYLQLDEIDDTFSERIVLTAGGRQSAVRQLLERHQVTAVYPDFNDDSRIVIIRTRQGFALPSVAELRTYWHAYLADTSRTTAHAAASPADLLPLQDLGPYNDIARAFLALWANGRIMQTEAGYLLDGTPLCTDRLRFYADCVADPECREVESHVIEEAATLAAEQGGAVLPADVTLLAWERALISRPAHAEAI